MPEPESDDTLHRPWGYFAARTYDSTVRLMNALNGGEKKWRGRFVDLVDPRRGERVLDLCCGTGTIALMIADRIGGGDGVFAADVSPAFIEVARRKARRRGHDIDFRVMDARRMGFPDFSFDKVVLAAALHEMCESDRKAVLLEAGRVLATGGRLFVLDIREPSNAWGRILFRLFFSPVNPCSSYGRELKGGKLRLELRDSGYRVECEGTSNVGFFEMYALAKTDPLA